MSDQTIPCPYCHKEIPLSEALSAKIETELRAKYEGEMQAKNKQFEEAKARLMTEKKQLEEQKRTQNEQVETLLRSREKVLQEDARRKAKEELSLEMQDAQKESLELKQQLQSAKKQELEFRKQMAVLEDQKRDMDLELQRKLDQERSRLYDKAKQDAMNESHGKLAESEKKIEIMQRTIDDLKRQSEQGSMQIQGEVQENDLKLFLQTQFPLDGIEDVPTGMNGADLVHTVKSPFGETCGVILWESKNTKTWGGDWIKKLKADQVSAKADACVLVSRVVPEHVKGCGSIDDVWVVEVDSVLPLISALRYHLLELNQVKRSLVGKGEKMELLYSYLSGSQFKLRVESIISAFSSLKADLDKERTAMNRIWEKREKELTRVMLNTSGMYGDLQGIIGAVSLPTLETLELPGSDTLF